MSINCSIIGEIALPFDTYSFANKISSINILIDDVDVVIQGNSWLFQKQIILQNTNIRL